MNLNRVELIGGLTRDPSFTTVGSGFPLAELSIALNGTKYDSTEKAQVVTTTYATVQAAGWLAEQVMVMGLTRGAEVYVLGALDQTEIEKADGTKDRKTRVVAARIEVTRSRSHQAPTAPASGAPRGGSQRPPEQPGWRPQPSDEAPF